jgi:hypothetical protein
LGRQSPQDSPDGWRGVTLLPPDLVGNGGRIMGAASPVALAA